MPPTRHGSRSGCPSGVRTSWRRTGDRRGSRVGRRTSPTTSIPSPARRQTSRCSRWSGCRSAPPGSGSSTRCPRRRRRTRGRSMRSRPCGVGGACTARRTRRLPPPRPVPRPTRSPRVLQPSANPLLCLVTRCICRGRTQSRRPDGRARNDHAAERTPGIRRSRTRRLAVSGRDSRTGWAHRAAAAAGYISREDETRVLEVCAAGCCLPRYPVSSPPSTGRAMPLT